MPGTRPGMTKKRDIFKLLEEPENAGCFFGQAQIQ
jgi:hypothetical protein